MTLVSSGQGLRERQSKKEALVSAFFNVMAVEDAQSDLVVDVLAEILAATAATLHIHGHRATLNDRMDAFVARVRERYPEILAEMIARRLKEG